MGCPVNKIKKDGNCVSNSNIITVTQPAGGGLSIDDPSPVPYDGSRKVIYSAPVGYSLNSWTGDCVGVSSGNVCQLSNIRSDKSVGAISQCSSGFLFNSASNSCIAMDSCKTLLANNPSYLNHDGLYDIVNSDTGEVYKAYCDMTTSGGGWTLLFSADSRTQWNVYQNFDATSLIWKGDDLTVITKNITTGASTSSKILVAATYSALDQQKAVKNVKFTQLSMNMYGITSSANSTFASKFINRTTWNYSTSIGGLSTCAADSNRNKWDVSICGSNTCHYGVLGCQMNNNSFGGDATGWMSLGGKAVKNSGYSCGSNSVPFSGSANQGGSGSGDTGGMAYWCNVSYLFTNPSHRGGTVYGATNDKSNMVWGR